MPISGSFAARRIVELGGVFAGIGWVNRHQKAVILLATVAMHTK